MYYLHFRAEKEQQVVQGKDGEEDGPNLNSSRLCIICFLELIRSGRWGRVRMARGEFIWLV